MILNFNFKVITNRDNPVQVQIYSTAVNDKTVKINRKEFSNNELAQIIKDTVQEKLNSL